MLRLNLGDPEGRKVHFQLSHDKWSPQLPWGWFTPENSLAAAAKQ